MGPWHKKGIALGVIYVGVHAGPAIVGNFSGGRFFDYTAYSDTINIAARLEAADKQLGTRICASAILAAKVKEFPVPPDGWPFAEEHVGIPSRLRDVRFRVKRTWRGQGRIDAFDVNQPRGGYDGSLLRLQAINVHHQCINFGTHEGFGIRIERAFLVAKLLAPNGHSSRAMSR